MIDKTTQSILNGLPQPIVAIGVDERIAFLNQEARALFGAGVEGRHYATAIRQPALLEAIDRVGRGGEPEFATLMRSTGGSDQAFRVHVAPFEGRATDGQARARPLVLSFEDVSQQRAAGQIRRDFVANVSHELRTPLTALTGFIDTLQGAARDDAAARDRFLAIMAREAGRMNRLVEDLLSLSRVEAEERMRPLDRIDLVALSRSAMASLLPLAEEAGARLELETTHDSLVVRGDADQLTQVLQNLVENGVKYGARGDIDAGANVVTIRLGVIAHEPVLRQAGAVMEVADRGPGIDPLHLPRLTERFYRVDSHRSREMGGTGLGLAIVKHIVNRHRGRLRITSEKGQGSRFTVILPME